VKKPKPDNAHFLRHSYFDLCLLVPSNRVLLSLLNIDLIRFVTLSSLPAPILQKFVFMPFLIGKFANFIGSINSIGRQMSTLSKEVFMP